MVFPFPVAGDHVRLAYRELHIAINGTEEQEEALGGHALLPQPLELTTCLDPELRHDLWKWREDVVIWLNREYTRGRLRPHPGCWPVPAVSLLTPRQHPRTELPIEGAQV